MYVCMYVCTHMYVYTGPPFQDLGWVGGWVMGTPCIRLVTSQNMGQKLLTKRVGVMKSNQKGFGWGGGWGCLAPSLYIKGQMVDKTRKFVIENHTIHLQMEAFYIINKTHKVVIKNPMIPLTPTHMPWLTPE